MSVAVTWLAIGVPALVVALVLLLDRSPLRALLAYLVLAAGFVGLAVFDRASAAGFGALIALIYAAGRGGTAERERPRDDAIGVPSERISDEGHGHVGATGPGAG